MTFACNSLVINNLRVEQGEWVYLHASRDLQEDAPTYEKMSMVVPYGDGKACNRIVRVLKDENVERYGGSERDVDFFLEEDGWDDFQYHVMYHLPPTKRQKCNQGTDQSGL